EVELRQVLYGYRALHLPDRRKRQDLRGVAQRPRQGPCRGCARGGEEALIASSSLTAAAARVLGTADPVRKAAEARQMAALWRARRIGEIGAEPPPARPARPDRPALRPPREM